MSVVRVSFHSSIDVSELQLKCSHVPFKLVSYWEEVLDKYTEFSAEDEERGQP